MSIIRHLLLDHYKYDRWKIHSYHKDHPPALCGQTFDVGDSGHMWVDLSTFNAHKHEGVTCKDCALILFGMQAEEELQSDYIDQ